MRHPTFHVGPFVVSLVPRTSVHEIHEIDRARMLMHAFAAEKGMSAVRAWVEESRALAYVLDDAEILELGAELLLHGIHVAIDNGRELRVYDDPDEGIPISDLVPDEPEERHSRDADDPAPERDTSTWVSFELTEARGSAFASGVMVCSVDGAEHEKDVLSLPVRFDFPRSGSEVVVGFRDVAFAPARAFLPGFEPIDPDRETTDAEPIANDIVAVELVDADGAAMEATFELTDAAGAKQSGRLDRPHELRVSPDGPVTIVILPATLRGGDE